MNRPSIWSWRNAIRKSSLPPLAKLCCYVLADYMSDAGKGCFPSIVTLMKDTGLSNTSIAKHLRLAVEAGLLVKHRFRDRAGHCAGTNYYPRFPERVEEEPAAEPATLGAGAFFDVPKAPETAKIEPAARPSRRSPWADYPRAESLSEPSRPDEFQPVPALTPLTHNCPIEPSNRKLLQHALDENRDQGGAERRGARSSRRREKRWQGRDRDRVCGLDAGCREACDPGLRLATHGGKEVDAAQGALVDGRA